MPVHGRLMWNIDDYLEQLAKAEKGIDQVVFTLLDENRDYFGGLMYHYLRSTSDQWTGATAKTLFVSPVQRDGNFIFVELGANTQEDPSAWYKEFGRPNQAAEPFLRTTLAFLRRQEMRRLMGQAMEKMGLQA